MPTLNMLPEHWKKLGEMAREQESSLTDAEADALIRSDEIMSFVRSGRPIEWHPETIEKYAPRLKEPS